MFLVFCVTIFSSAQLDSELIDHDGNVQLSWRDFKAKPNDGHSFHAVTDWGMVYSCSLDGEILEFNLVCQFNKLASWVEEEEQTKWLLAHEQGHFDLAEIHTRRFRKAMLESRLVLETIEKTVQALYDKHFKACIKDQGLYDKETDHSQNEPLQKRWNNKIATDMKNLSRYSDKTSRIRVGH